MEFKQRKGDPVQADDWIAHMKRIGEFTHAGVPYLEAPSMLQTFMILIAGGGGRGDECTEYLADTWQMRSEHYGSAARYALTFEHIIYTLSQFEVSTPLTSGEKFSPSSLREKIVGLEARDLGPGAAVMQQVQIHTAT